jgi:peptidoglycan/LPS O-acetylase OafA/YrhL
LVIEGSRVTTPSARDRLGYRPDIDGLRALAVLAVVGFHLFPHAVPGGFAGVDVFFVISGYLITRIIVEATDAGTFSYLKFYAHRSRRIFPALVLVLVTTVALASLVLPPEEVERVGRHVVAGALFSSNFALWHETGYFDAASSTKPLLHLWSLGIEEQFYLLWPAMMLLMSRARRHRLASVIAIGIASFAVNVLTVGPNPTAAFYSPASRAWELMIGAAVGLASLDARWGRAPQPWREAASICGMGLIVAAIARFDAHLPFPGWYALVPTLGAALTISAGRDSWINRRVLAHKGAVGIGLISYPLYLWHWPLLVLLRRVTDDHGPAGAATLTGATVVVLLSFLAAYATYRFVELPLRRPPLARVAKRASLALAGAAVFGVVAVAWPVSNYGDDPDTLVAREAHRDWHSPKSNDAVYFATKGPGGPVVVFLGDSHMEMYYPTIKHAAETQAPVPVVAFSTHGGCAILPTVYPEVCAGAYARAMKLAALPSVRRVVIASKWDMYGFDDPGSKTPIDARRVFGLLAHDIEKLRRLGKEVVIIAAHPNAPEGDPELLAAHLRIGLLGTRAPTRFAPSFPRAVFEKRAALANGWLRKVASETGARVIDPADFLCSAVACPTTDERGKPLRIDANHLRPFAVARYLTYVPALVVVQPRVASPPRHRHARDYANGR